MWIVTRTCNHLRHQLSLLKDLHTEIFIHLRLVSSHLWNLRFKREIPSDPYAPIVRAVKKIHLNQFVECISMEIVPLNKPCLCKRKRRSCLVVVVVFLWRHLATNACCLPLDYRLCYSTLQSPEKKIFINIIIITRRRRFSFRNRSNVIKRGLERKWKVCEWVRSSN